MAYVSQEKKKKIAEKLKTVMPKEYKYSLAVRHSSTIVLTIAKGPAPELSEDSKAALEKRGYLDINQYHLERQAQGKTLEFLKKANEALNTDNFDESDAMTDYFHVGHYVNIRFGRWDKSFQANA